ncbi:MAG: acetyl-CoA carboxylase biotin carboxylase subunit [Deltaproteobacteria bacterium]|nr:acetyl-CoA carboxylase biotin carboxylase subunit [Deltaproteobacteria bacterium]
MFSKILIANRGEIALRIVRACREMDIHSVAVYSDADAESLHVKLADEAVNIGPALSRKSYLSIDNIIQAAKNTGAQAIHPGYGFLSENETFVQRCRENRICFIGPPPRAIALAGNKSRARKTVEQLDIPMKPESEDDVSSVEEAFRIAGTIGYPVIIKASGGGGGRGMRIANDQQELVEAFAIAAGEARAAFGNPDLYIEKYIEKPRHIEIQILADQSGNIVHLGERECSIQKRYQKLIEESPSPLVDADLRERMGAMAIRVARAIGYENAGTMEFLVDENKHFYFMEVNARVQVEHPVTELVTGIDIVQEQIRIAAGEAMNFTQEDIQPRGWAIECRINAADPDNDFMPSPGKIESAVMPGGPGVRVDTHIYNGYTITPFYDSLIGKLIVWASDRPAAIQRLKRALSEVQIRGIKVTTPFYQRIVDNEDFRAGNIDTHFLERLNL